MLMHHALKIQEAHVPVWIFDVCYLGSHLQARCWMHTTQAMLLQIFTAFFRIRACYGDDFLIVDH